MTEIRDNIRSSLALSVVSSLLIGVAMNYGYGYARGMLAPFGAFIGENLIDPYSEWLWWKTALLNFAYSAVCGLLVAMVSLAVMQYLLKPKAMLFPQVAGLSYIIASYWWFVSDVQGVMRAASSEHILVALVSTLIAIGVWFLSAWWLVRRNSPIKSNQPAGYAGD